MLRLTLKPLRSPSQGPASLHSGLTGNNLVSADTKRAPGRNGAPCDQDANAGNFSVVGADARLQYHRRPGPAH